MRNVDVRFERIVLDSVGRILLGPVDRRNAAASLVSVADRIGEIPAVVFKHKVTTIAATNAAVLSDSSDARVTQVASTLQRLLRPDYEAAMRHRALLEAELGRLANVLGQSAVVLKGFCNARFYPNGYVRWMRDIDLMCDTWADAMGLLERLLEVGYQYDRDESSWVKADHRRGRPLYGQIFLIRPEGEDFCRVDIHYGTYSVGYSGYLDLDIIASSTLEQVADHPVRVFEPEACLLIAQSHALSDGYVAVKDVNDFVSIAVSRPEVDWAAAGCRLRGYRLAPQAALLARHVASLYTDHRVVGAAKTLLAALDTPRRTLWQTHNRNWTLRAVVNTSFAYRWHRHIGDPTVLSAWRALQCFAFYIRRLELAVRPRSFAERLLHRMMARPDLRMWRLRPDACTLLIDSAVVAALAAEPDVDGPVEAVAVDDGIRVLSRRGFDFVAVRGRVFVPTLDLLIPPAQAACAPRCV